MILAMVVNQGFSFNTPSAGAPIRLGYCRGFAQVGIPHKLVPVPEIEYVLPYLDEPFVFLSIYDYLDMTEAARATLRKYPHFVWVTPDYDTLKEVYDPYGIVRPRLPQTVFQRVLDSGPAFVWGDVPPSCLEFYSFWRKAGLRLVSLPLACDPVRYYPEPENLKYPDTKIAYVGGYWAKKAVQFEQYLRPYEDILTVFGYTLWPYRGYLGFLPDDDERVFYQNARVCPAISEPCVVKGFITERAFKVVGSGGLAVTDVAPAYRELFAEDELLVPESMDEYHGMIQRALTDDEFGQGYRERGHRAILERHTYAHRAQTILGYLNI